MELTFLGGARTVTGSRHLVDTGRARVLIDCGMFQGGPDETMRNRVPLGFDPATLDAVVLTHAHLDHCGLLPLLVGHGFRGQIICTAATAPKVKALSSRPHVAMTIDVGDTPTEAKALLVRGLASVDIVNGVPDEYIAASAKVLGADQMAEFERQVRSTYDQMARISIEPLWVRFFDFGAGRLPSFLTKLAGDA